MTNKIIFSIAYFLAVIGVGAWAFNDVNPYLGLIILIAGLITAIKYYERINKSNLKNKKNNNEKF